MTWRYQPVMLKTGYDETIITFCQVYFDRDGILTAWSDIPSDEVGPTIFGNDAEDLRFTLTAMRESLNTWLPIDYESLSPDTKFERVSSASG